MKIAITSLYLPSGSKIGVGYQVHYLANELVKRGHRVTVFSQTGRCDDSLYDVTAVPPGGRLRTFGFAAALRRHDFTDFDVLNAHGDDWFLWGVDRPRHVHTFHGSCFAEMLNAKGLTNKLRMAALAACEYNALLLPDETVAVSANTRRYIPFIRHVIPNGVSLESFCPTDDKAPEPTILFVGTMHGRKRGAMLLDLFRRDIRPKVPHAQFWAVCEEKVEGDGVTWFGRVPTPRLAELFRKAWVFCLPSTYEGFGVPYIEAMASGTPVVASPNPGALEVMRQGSDGLVVPDQELASTLIRVLEDAPMRETLRAAGLARSRDFGWDRVCSRYEVLYRGHGEELGETERGCESGKAVASS